MKQSDSKIRVNDEMPKKKFMSMQVDLKKFELATEEEKKQQDHMRESTSFLKDSIKKFKKDVISTVCLCIVLFLLLVAFIVPLFYPYDYKTTSSSIDSVAAQYLAPFEYSKREQILMSDDVIFAGWSTKDYRDNEYYGLAPIDSEEEFNKVKEYLVDDSVEVKDGTITLYAVWIVDKDKDGKPDFGQDYFKYSGSSKLIPRYQLSYNLNGGSGNAPKDNFQYVANDTIVPAKLGGDVKNEDYQFMGWSKEELPILTADNFELISDKIIAKNLSINEDTVLYAAWGEKDLKPGYAYGGKTKTERYQLYYNGNMAIEDVPKDSTKYAPGDKIVPKFASVKLTNKQGKVFPHLLGTDEQGRDYAIRIIVGTRVSLLVGIIAAAVVVVIGIIYGAISGYFGGKLDLVMMRIVDIIYSLPDTLIIILLSVSLRDVFTNGEAASVVASMGGAGLISILIVFAMLYWVGMARLVRGQILSLREQEFVLAAKASGAKPWWIIRKHMIPNCISVIFISATLQIPSAIFTESFLSYLGVGVSIPMPSLGSLASDYRGQMTIPGREYLFLIPALVIFLLVLSLNLVGQGLRDAFDPKLKEIK